MRAAVILRRNEQVLLIHRVKDGRDYHVVPGGSIEAGETPATTAAREIREETGLTVAALQPLGTSEDDGRTTCYFLAVRFSGTLGIGEPERSRTSVNNRYLLEWTATSRLESLNLQPPSAAAMIALALHPSGQ